MPFRKYDPYSYGTWYVLRVGAAEASRGAWKIRASGVGPERLRKKVVPDFDIQNW